MLRFSTLSQMPAVSLKRAATATAEAGDGAGDGAEDRAGDGAETEK